MRHSKSVTVSSTQCIQSAFSPKPTAASPVSDAKPIQPRWVWYDGADLTFEIGYKILELRAAIFIEEQGYAYNDLDNRDLQAHHLTGWVTTESDSNQLIASARLMAPDHNQGLLEIGRVVVHKNYRQYGLGTRLMERMLSRIDQQFAHCETHLVIADDQFTKHLPKFYGKFGFQFNDHRVTEQAHYHYSNFTIKLTAMVRSPRGIPPRNEQDESSHTEKVTAGFALGTLGLFAASLRQSSSAPDTSSSLTLNAALSSVLTS